MSTDHRLIRSLRLGHARGQGLVEFALVVPIFFMLLIGMIDIGRIIYAQQTLNQDAREATRVGSVSIGSMTTPALWQARYADIRAAAKKLSVSVPFGDADIVGLPVAGDPSVPTPDGCQFPLPTDAVAPDDCFYPDGYLSASIDPGRVYVKITITLPILTPVISDILGGSVTLTGISEAEIHS